jgi:hypothetical protein
MSLLNGALEFLRFILQICQPYGLENPCSPAVLAPARRASARRGRSRQVRVHPATVDVLACGIYTLQPPTKSDWQTGGNATH